MENIPTPRDALLSPALHWLIVCLLFFTISKGEAQVIPYRSSWKYATESNTAPSSTWKTSGFNDAGWKTGNAPFGFGNHVYNTTLEKGPNNTTPHYPAYYFRKTVNIASTAAYSAFRLRAYLDDGIVIYVNGVEVKRKNMNANPNDPYTGKAGDSLTIDTLLSTSFFQNGNNLIAAEVHQTGSTSSDILFDLQLDGQNVSLTRYPYLQLASYDRMTVQWYTSGATTATVRYSTDADLEIYKEVSSAKNDTLHSVTLRNLNPDSKYYYSVGYYQGSEFRQLQYNPAVNYFRTSPSAADTSHTIRFWLLGDSGAGTYKNPRPIKVRDAYLAYLNARGNPHVDGLLFLGDNSNTSPYEGLQLALDTTLFRYYNRPTDQQLLSRMPSWTVIGNHDYDSDATYVHSDGNTYNVRKAYHKLTAASFSTFAYPDSAQIGGEPTYNKNGYYSFNQGNVHFVVLNPPLIESQNRSDNWVEPFVQNLYNLYSKNSIALDNKYDTPIESLPQVKWLIKDLLSNTKKWTVVTFHLPPFSTIGHFPTEYDMKRVQERLLPILEKPEYHVDALIVSHSHAYLRAGMIRKTGSQARTTDYQQTGGLAGNGNLGRYPASRPYIKTNSETAYTYVLSGSAGRGWYDVNNPSDNDAGFPTSANVQHPSTSVPPLDNLTGDNSTDFYHKQGGSVELFFKENRLDVKFIKESDASPRYVIADSFVVMKDVNKKTTYTLQNGGDVVKLKASWVGDYNWYLASNPSQILTSGVRELSLGPNQSSTFYVRDQSGFLADTFIVNVVRPSTVVMNDTLIPYRSQWLYPLVPGFSAKNIKMNEQCVAPWTFSVPPFEIPGKGILGLGHSDEGTVLSNMSMEKVFLIADRMWFRRSFTLNGSTLTYANFKLTLIMDKNLSTRKSFTTKLHTIVINGREAVIQSSTSRDIANNREEITYTLANTGFSYGINYILVSFYLTPASPLKYPMEASSDPFTFDAQLISTSLASAPPPRTKQLKLANVALASGQVCAGDTVSVKFSTLSDQTDLSLMYEAQLVTPSGDIPLAESALSPILVRLPGDLKEGFYKIKIATKSAFMDLAEGPEVKVKVLPKATIVQDSIITVWRGQVFSMPVTLEGGGPWNYILSDSTSGTSQPEATSIEVRARKAHTYTISSIANSCGTGEATGSFQVQVTEPVLSVGKVSGLTLAPLKTALCDGDSISVAYSVVGPAKERTYAVELSDPNGDFGAAVVLGSGKANPFAALLPTTTSEGDKYRVRMKALNPDVDFTLGNSEVMVIRKMAVGNFTLSKEAVYDNEELKLNVALTGTVPIYYFLRYGADTLHGSASQAIPERTIRLRQTTVFSLDSVRNVCGYGSVSGNRTVTVTFLVGVDPLSVYGITAYPNPASERVMLRSKRSWKGSLQWKVYQPNGKIIQRGAGKPQPNTPFEIDVSGLPAGLYILGLTEGEKESTWKIVKK